MIRILIADDHTIVREGLRLLLNNQPGFELAGEAANGVEAVQRVRELKPDVILMDLVMPEKDGITAIREIIADNPEAHILVLTSYGEDEKAFSAIKAGAMGYLLKDTSPEQLIQSIKDVYQGNFSMHPNIARKLFKEINQQSALPPTHDPLSEREVDVLKLVAQGMTDQEIATRLFISSWTVHTHVRNILAKLHLANRTQAALYAQRTGLTDT
jgi:two-component system, NarL family, response regulator LiaR